MKEQLTDRELDQQMLEALERLHRTGDTQVFDMYAAPVLIPALRNRLARQEQEPVAWLFTNVQSGDIEASTNPDEKQGEREYWHPAPLYTAPPPAREWQGLTLDEWREIDDAHDWTTTQGRRAAYRAHEAKLKEKNHG